MRYPAGHADAHRNPVTHGRPCVGNSSRVDGRAHSLSHLHCSRSVGVRQYHCELFASIPSDQIAATIALAYRCRHPFEALVTRLMTVPVVIQLEVVYITDQERKRVLYPTVTAPLL